jgi:pimeloyl-ACP methyl ester carboxylesterase
MIKKGYVDTKRGQIHYRYTEYSSALPVLVMIHQTVSTSVMFEAVMSRLEKYYRIIAPDFPGYGNSFEPEKVPDISYYADVLLEAIDNLEVQDFHSFGHHTGGGIALDMAVRFPKRVKTLGMIGPIYADKAQRDVLRNITTEMARQIVPKKDGSHLLIGWKMLETYGADQLPAEIHHREAMGHLTGWKACSQAFSAILEQDFIALFKKVNVPLLIMCSHDDVLWPYFPKAREARPDAEAVVVRGTDFQCDMDPDGVAMAIHGFLQKYI